MIPGVAPLVTALRVDDPDRFYDNFDARVICEHKKDFSPYQDRIEQWTNDRLRAKSAIGLRLPRGRDAVCQMQGANDEYRARWVWPARRFSQSCILGFSKQTPQTDSEPEDLRLEDRRTITRDFYEEGRGAMILVEEGLSDCQVIVWAVIELGFCSVVSQPLMLGRLRPRPAGQVL